MFHVVCVLSFLVLTIQDCSAKNINKNCDVSAYADWLDMFDRQVTADDYAHRCAVFTANKQLVDNHNALFNAGKTTFRTKWQVPWADRTEKERLESVHFRGRLPTSEWQSGPRADRVANPALDGVSELPNRLNHWDFSEETNTEDQGQYGNCWAFAAVEVVEFIHAHNNKGSLMQFSAQQVSDCTPHCLGCLGGFSVDGLQYLKNASGICNVKQYPYQGCDICQNDVVKTCGNNSASFKEVIAVPKSNVSALAHLLPVSAIAVAIDASGQCFGYYADGVYDGTCNGKPECGSETSNLDHEVLAIGLQLNDPEFHADSIIIKNSWGLEWGNMNGHILFQLRNKTGAWTNTCGMATDACYAV